MQAIQELYANAVYQQEVVSGTDRVLITVKNTVSGEFNTLEFVREDGKWYFNDPQIKAGIHPECAIDGAPTASGPTLDPVPASPVLGYTLFRSDRFEYSIQYPSDWEVQPSASVPVQGQTIYVDYFLGPERNDFTTNLNIGVFATNGATRDQVYAREVGDAESRHDDARSEDIQLIGQPAKRFTYTAGKLSNQAPFDQEQIIVVYNGQEWVLTFSTALGELDMFRETFDTMAGTFAPP